MSYKGVRMALNGADHSNAGPVLAMHFRKNGTELSLFTAIATLGTPQDITLQELRIESFFPMDDATATLLRSWATLQRVATRTRAAERAPAARPSTS
jgi:hypothetical protein